MSSKDYVRRMCKALEAQFPIYREAMPLKPLKAFVTKARSIISNPTLAKHKRHPKIDKIEEHLQNKEPFGVSELLLHLRHLVLLNN